MIVDRCVCRGVTFDELIERARARGESFEQLCRATGAGMTCGLCREYIRLSLATGTGRWPPMTPATIEGMLRTVEQDEKKPGA